MLTKKEVAGLAKKKDAQTVINFTGSKKSYAKLKKELLRDGVTVKRFFTATMDKYLAEKAKG